MSWSICSICNKHKYITEMVLFNALDNGSMIICKFCLDTGYSEMSRAIGWLPQIDLSKVQDSVSRDPSKDRLVSNDDFKKDAWIKRQTDAQKSYLKKMAERGMLTAQQVLEQMALIDEPNDGIQTTDMNEAFVQACMLDARSYRKFVPYSTIEYWRDCMEALVYKAYMQGKEKGSALERKKTLEDTQ